MSFAAFAVPCCLVLAALLVACSGRGEGGPGGPGGPPGGPPAVSVAPAVQRQVQEFDEYTARLEAAESVEVRARVAGTLEGVHFREGQRVARGQLLYTLDARPFAAEVARAEAQLAAIRSQLELARSEAARAEKLVAIQGISAQELDQLRAAVRGGEANARAAEAALQTARLNQGYTRVVSPIAGRASRTMVTAGNLVGAGDPILTTVVSMDKVYAWFDASEAQYLRYQKAAREGTRPSSRDTPNTVLMGLADETGHPHAGRMDFVDNRLNPATATIRGRAVFDNAGGRFTPGLSARLKLVGSGAYDAVLVPERAIGTDQTRKVVLTLGPNNIVTPREVQLGALIDGMRVVQGVKAGENVIVDGLQRAFPGAPVTPQVLKVDDKGMPIQPPPGAPQGAPAAPASAASAAKK
jgi:RND family efflux transporter MFP subunit